MKEIDIKKSFFKTRKEVEQYFNQEMFKFSLMTENTVYFDTLNPISIDGLLTDFTVAFYYEDSDFFTYSSFKGREDWFSKMQLAEVWAKQEELNERTQLYFETYDAKFKY